MEVSGATVTGAFRVGLQVVSAQKRPVLEVYYQLRNTFRPEIEIPISDGYLGTDKHIIKSRFQDIFVQFTLINIGSERAENIKLSIDGELKRNVPRDNFGGAFEAIFPQIPPGQSLFLFSMNQHDLNEYPEGGGKSLGLKRASFTISIDYDAGKGLLNWLLSIPSKLRSRRRFNTKFVFYPQLVEGDLPPAEYL